jgi:hypothetical protein
LKRVITLSISLLLAVTFFTTFEARALSNVTVTFRTSLANRIATKDLCNVNVPEGADGVAVFDAAIKGGCLQSYQLSHFGSDDFVDCLDSICGEPGTYWAMYENGSYTSYGVRGFSANQGDELWFNYEQYLSCFLPTGC